MSVINWEQVETLSCEEIENLRITCLKEIQTMNDSLSIVLDEFDAVSRQMITLEGTKKDLSISIRKAKENIRKKKTDADILERKFWQNKKL